MNEKNCVEIHLFAEAHSCKRLMERSMDYILEHFCAIYQQVRHWSIPYVQYISKVFLLLAFLL